MLRVHNTGNLHAQLGPAVLDTDAGAQFSISKGLLGYVLVGESREWQLAVDQSAQLGRTPTIRATVNATAVSVTPQQ